MLAMQPKKSTELTKRPNNNSWLHLGRMTVQTQVSISGSPWAVLDSPANKRGVDNTWLETWLNASERTNSRWWRERRIW